MENGPLIRDIPNKTLHSVRGFSSQPCLVSRGYATFLGPTWPTSDLTNQSSESKDSNRSNLRTHNPWGFTPYKWGSHYNCTVLCLFMYEYLYVYIYICIYEPPCHSLGGVGVVHFVVDFGFSLQNGFCTLQNGSSINPAFYKMVSLGTVLINNYVQLCSTILTSLFQKMMIMYM